MFRKGSPSTLSPWGWMLAQGSAEGPSSMGLKFPPHLGTQGRTAPARADPGPQGDRTATRMEWRHQEGSQGHT